MIRRACGRAAAGRWLLLLLAGWLAGGCGKKAPPLPPLGHRPLPPASTAAAQRGDTLEISFRIPDRRTDGTPLEGMPDVRVLRAVPGGRPRLLREVAAADLEATPGAAATVRLPLAGLYEGLPGDRVVVSVVLVGPSGRASDPSPGITVPRAVGPPDPVGLTVQPTPAGIALAWALPADAPGALAFNVYRRAPGDRGWGAPRNAAPLEARDFTDTAVIVGRAYEYEVRSVVPGAQPGRESAGVRSAAVVFEDRTAPGAPASLRAVAEPGGIRLFWFPPGDADLAAFRIYRAVDDGEFAPMAEVPADDPSFLDREVVPATLYRYRVTALDGARPANEGPASEPVAETAGPGEEGSR